MPEKPYDDDKSYAVQFKRPVQKGPFKYLPRDTPVMRGSALNKIVEEYGPDVVRSANEQ